MARARSECPGTNSDASGQEKLALSLTERVKLFQCNGKNNTQRNRTLRQVCSHHPVLQAGQLPAIRRSHHSFVTLLGSWPPDSLPKDGRVSHQRKNQQEPGIHLILLPGFPDLSQQPLHWVSVSPSIKWAHLCNGPVRAPDAIAQIEVQEA